MGTARSGTTALCELLNAHPSICIGIERYKHLVARPSEIQRSLFQENRFFDFRPEETNHIPKPGGKWQGIYSRMREKWDTAHVVGDKIPHLFNVIDQVWPAIPEARLIYIVRDIHAVADSWNAAAASNPRWAAVDHKNAVAAWNRANCTVASYLPNRQLLVVPYERLFGGAVEQIDRICRFLDVQNDLELLKAYDKAVAYYLSQIVVRPSRSLQGQAEFIEEKADWQTYHAVKAAGASRQA